MRVRLCMTICIRGNDAAEFVRYYRNPDIGKAYKARWPSVERAIRTCVISCWERGNRDFLNEMAGYPLRERPTVSEFFSIAWVYLCREEQKERNRKTGNSKDG